MAEVRLLGCFDIRRRETDADLSSRPAQSLFSAHLERGDCIQESARDHLRYAWICLENPFGMFEDWNPKVSCR